MHDVNWWLMSLAFLLGLLLTLAMMIRRVTREVPVTHALAATAAAATAGTVATKAVAKAAQVETKIDKKIDKVETKVETKLDRVETKIDKVLEKEPYGAGSIRVSARTAAPVGYTIKGDKDTGRYFTLDSPEYAAIEAEVWFADERSAQKAGFLRWDAKGDRTAPVPAAESAAVITEQHAPADIVINEDHSATDAKLVIVDSGSPEVDSKLRIISSSED
jgi:hypothetical protein